MIPKDTKSQKKKKAFNIQRKKPATPIKEKREGKEM
jgi:hypothetical protein